MNREELKAMGLTDEQIGSVMENYGKSVVNLQKSADEKDAELKKYQKGGEYYTDPKEIERLKTFETETKAEKAKATKDKAFDAMLTKLKVKDDFKKLLKKSLNYDELEVTDKGEIAEAYEKKFVEGLKADCPSVLDTPPAGTGINFGNVFGAEKTKGAEPTNDEWGAAITAKQNSK